MTKLSDTQLVILTAACSRDDRRVLPLPASLKGGAANKVVNSLMTKGMVTEVNAERDDLVWRTSEDDRRTTLRVSASPLNPFLMSVGPVASHTRTPAGTGIIAAAPPAPAP
jgi:hypothetical protein